MARGKLSRSYNLSTFLYVVFLHTNTETYCVSVCDGGSCRQDGTEDCQLEVLTSDIFFLLFYSIVGMCVGIFHIFHSSQMIGGHVLYIWQWISLILSTLFHSHSYWVFFIIKKIKKHYCVWCTSAYWAFKTIHSLTSFTFVFMLILRFLFEMYRLGVVLCNLCSLRIGLLKFSI